MASWAEKPHGFPMSFLNTIIIIIIIIKSAQMGIDIIKSLFSKLRTYQHAI